MTCWHELNDKLREMYPTASMVEMMSTLGKTREAIYKKAQELKLSRPRAGRFQVGNVFGALRVREKKPNQLSIQTRVKMLMEETGTAWTSPEIADHLKITRSAATTVLGRLHQLDEIHVSGHKRSRSKHGPENLAQYTIGEGDDVPASEALRAAMEPVPIPTPELGPWGCVWPQYKRSEQPTGEIT